MAVYSLTHYQVVVEVPQSIKKYLSSKDAEKGLVFGGSGSYLESIDVKVNNDTYTVKGDYTGSYIHTLNGDRTGECNLTINQVSKSGKVLYKLINLYFNKTDDNGALLQTVSFPSITVINLRTNEKVAEAREAFLKRPADLKFTNEAVTQEWSFVCGEVIIHGS